MGARSVILDDNRFVTDTVVGEGATSRVWRARDLRSGRAVAVKVLRSQLVDDDEIVGRFEVEADLLSGFDHPNLLPVLGRGRTSRGSPWYATALASRGSLADQMLRHGTFAPDVVIAYVVELLDALEHVHAAGVVHRDVKPANVLIDADDVAMLGDFGVALAPEQRRTLVGSRMGTPSFMPPEQYDDPAGVTPQADLFGAGVTLFVAITGQTGMSLIVGDLRKPALAGLPPAVAAVVDRATRPRPSERFASAREMAMALADASPARG